MDETKKTQLIKFLGMTGSKHDGEALNAVRIANRLLGSLGITWEEVFRKDIAGGRYSDEDLQKTANDAYELGAKDGYARGHAEGVKAGGAGKPVSGGGPKWGIGSGFNDVGSWRAFAKRLHEDYEDDMTEWEQGFVESFIARGFPKPTPKQQAVFERIAEKLGVECPA